MRRAVIVGGGIGGMTAALALRKVGFEVVVLERRRKLDDLHAGGGMVLWHNAMRALGSLGIAGEVEAAGSALERMDWTTDRGGHVASWPLLDLNAELGLKAIGVARSDLHAVLTRAVGGQALTMGADVIRTEPDGDGVTAILEGGDQVRGDVLVGADGINSATRVAQIGDGPLRPAGYDLSFGMVEAERGSGDAFKEYVGRGARFIVFPVGRGLTYWSAIYVTGRHDEAGHAADPAVLLDLYRGWPDPIESLIEATDARGIYRRDIADRAPVDHWGAGRVTLLGDAAHPMTPNLGQGACQAIEDAVVLAKNLAALPADDVGALRSYEQRRFARTAAFVNRSRWIGAMGCWKQPMACLLRDQIQRIVFPLAYLGHRRDMAYEP